jgi:hypothetical protein
MAVAPIARLARGTPCRAASDGTRLASARLSPVLDVEEPTSHGTAGSFSRCRALIREMSTANPLWGAPRIHGELQELGISVSQSTVAKYMRGPRRPPSQTWRTFLTNHANQIMAADLLVVPTVSIRVNVAECCQPGAYSHPVDLQHRRYLDALA